MTDALNLNNADAVIDMFEAAADAMRASTFRQGCAVRLPARGRLIATGDLHDNPFHLEKIITLTRLDASPDHHVVLHEMIHGERLLNGMDFSYRMLGRVAQYVVDYPDQVHPILANHELAQLTGRGVSKGAGNSVELFNDALDFVFGEDAFSVAEAMNEFLLSFPLALFSEDGVMCAHSLPNARMMNTFDADIFNRDLTGDDYVAPLGSAYLLTWGRKYTDEQVAEFAERWNVKLFCLGHEHAETGLEMRGPQTLILNSDHERATVLPLDLADLPTAEEALMFGVPLSSVG